MAYNLSMPKEKQAQESEPKRLKSTYVLVIVLLSILVLSLVFYGMQPKRSITAYCKVYAQEKARLAKLPGDTWPSGVFNDEIGDAGELATSFGRLERVAPDEIGPDVATLQKLYQKIHDDPSQAMSASISGIGAETSVKNWAGEHCAN